MIFVSQNARVARMPFPVLPLRAQSAVAFVEQPKRVRFLRNEDGGEPKPAASNIQILSSHYPPMKADSGSALELSYQLASAFSVTVRFYPSAIHALVSHCGLSIRQGYEVAGVLAGRRREISGTVGNTVQYYLDVTDVLPIESQDRSGSHIRVNEESWGSVERMLLDLSGSQDKCKLAWYHTHPTQGIFFSRGDWESHVLFPRPYQFAIVVDPGSMQAGLFYWSDFDRKLQGEPLYFSLKQETE
jgi:proteasome lid subunit RPN8/RPN11